ncbi:MAG: hypothetical protein Q8M01_22960 [Rubrivivax sp.]|nr:hypothetical protein [Rubrivivax sp.]
MIDITLLPGPPAAPGGPCVVALTISNVGAEAVEFDNPAALLDKPLWRVSRRPDAAPAVISNRQNFVPPEGQAPRLRLAPGARWRADLPLELPEHDTGPGERSVVLLLETPTGVVESAPCVVKVQDWRITAAGAGHGVPAFDENEGDTLLLQAGPDHGTLYRMGWGEDDSDRQGTGGSAPLRLLDVGHDACDLLVPVRDAPFWRDPSRWLLWREQAVVCALDTTLQLQSLTLPTAPAELLRPALQRDGGPVELFALSSDRRRLDLLRFARHAAGTAERVQQISLPLAAAAGRAAFAPTGGLMVAATAAVAGGVALLLHRGADWQVARLADAELLSTCPPAVQALDGGDVLVTAAVQTADGIAIASARFAPSGASVSVRTGLGPVPGTVDEGALLVAAVHEHDGRAAPRTHLVLRLLDGTLWHLNERGLLEQVEFVAPPVRPLTLAPGSHGAFILVCDPHLGPFMAEA